MHAFVFTITMLMQALKASLHVHKTEFHELQIPTNRIGSHPTETDPTGGCSGSPSFTPQLCLLQSVATQFVIRD